MSFDPAPDDFRLYAEAVIGVNLDQTVSRDQGALMAQLSTNGNFSTSEVAEIGSSLAVTMWWVWI